MLSLLLELEFKTRAQGDDVEHNKSYGGGFAWINSAGFMDLLIYRRFINIVYPAEM